METALWLIFLAVGITGGFVIQALIGIGSERHGIRNDLGDIRNDLSDIGLTLDRIKDSANEIQTNMRMDSN